MEENYFARKRRERQPSQSMTVKSADPLLPGKVVEQGTGIAKTNAETTRITGTTPYDIRQAAADAAKAEADLRDGAAKEADRVDAAAKKKAADEATLARIATLVDSMDNLRTDAADGGGWFETGFTGSLLRGRPGTASYDLGGRVKNIQGNQFIDALREMKSQSASGSTGAGGLTEQEGQRILAATGNLDPDQSQGQFLEQIRLAQESALGAYRRLGGNDPMVDPTLPNPGDKMDGTTPMIANPGGGRPALTSGVKDEVDPILKGVASRVGRMIANPAKSDKQIRDFLQANGVDPANTSIAQALSERKKPSFKAWQRKFPGEPYPVGPNFYTKQVPLSPVQNLGNEAAQSGPGAFAIGAAQGLSGNRLDNITNTLGGDGEAINTALQLSRQNSPGMSFAGDLAGQAAAQYILGKVPGMGWTQKPGLGSVGDDAIYGAFAGQGDEDVGALSGALTNVTGGALGRGAAKVGKASLQGINNPSLSYLNNADVPLTIGRIGRGSGGRIGDTVGGLEERAAGLPVFDAIINSARQRGDVGFNKEMFRQVGAPVGDAGNGSFGVEGLINGRQTRNGAYSFLDSANMTRDPIYDAGESALNARLPGLPAFGDEVGRKLGLTNGAFDQSGNMTGRDWQSSIRSLRGDRGKLASQPFGDDAANVLGDAEANLSGLVDRQIPGGNEMLANANLVNANFKTAQASLKGRVAQRNGVLTDPSTLNAASIDGARKFGGLGRALEGRRPFASLTKAGMEVMPNMTPDSGTAGRSLLYSALPGLIGGGGIGMAAGGMSEDTSAAQGGAAGAGYGAASTILPTLALMALYSKGGQKGIQKMMLGKRPEMFGKISDVLNPKNPNRLAKAGRSLLSSRTAGNIGSASLRDLLLYPELGE